MTLLVKFILSAKDVGALSEFLRSILPDTQSFRGCKTADAFVALDEKSIVLLEEWEKQSDFDDYINWRKARGDFDSLIAQLAKDPELTYFSKQNSA